MVSVILVTFNSEKYIRETLVRVLKQTYKNIEIIIIDNNSKDSTKRILSRMNYKFTLIENSKNIGFSKANNQGIKLAKGEYILTLNHDAYLSLSYVENIVKFMDKNPMVGSCQGIFYRNLQKTKVDSCGIYLNFGFSANDIKRVPRENKEILACCAAACIYRKSVILKCKLFDPTYISYYEDLDLGVKIKRAGYKNYFIKSAESIHLRGNPNNFMNLKLSFVNKYKFLRKYRSKKVIFIAKIYDILKFPVYIARNIKFTKTYLSLLFKT
jgi:GT2 family glycosyltransferase